MNRTPLFLSIQVKVALIVEFLNYYYCMLEFVRALLYDVRSAELWSYCMFILYCNELAFLLGPPCGSPGVL